MVGERVRAAATKPQAWWLSEDGKERGPYSSAYVLAGLQSGLLTRETLARPEGGTRQRPLHEWRAFAAVTVTSEPPRPGSADQHPVRTRTSGRPARFPAFLLAGGLFLLMPLVSALSELALFLTGFDLSGLRRVVTPICIYGTLALLVYGLIDRRMRPNRQAAPVSVD